jgi:surface polysaccharide O-acyltransferase-like enzyme
MRHLHHALLPANLPSLRPPALFVTHSKTSTVATRIPSVETFRVAAMVSVIMIHTGFADHLQSLGGKHGFLALLTSQMWWFAVPFFFLTSGYFYGNAMQRGADCKLLLYRYSTVLLPIFLIWLLIYTVVPTNWPEAIVQHGFVQAVVAAAVTNLNAMASHALYAIQRGLLPVWHLWFIPALLVALATLTVLRLLQLEGRIIPPIACGLYGLALFEESFATTSSSYAYYFRMWFLAMLFALLGRYWSGRDKPTMRLVVCFLVGGAALHYIELMGLTHLFSWTATEVQDHVYLGGILFAFGIFTLALANPAIGAATWLPLCAPFTLGIYVSHVLIIYGLAPIHHHSQGMLWLLTFSLLVYFLTLGFTITLSRVPLAKYLVLKRHSTVA